MNFPESETSAPEGYLLKISGIAYHISSDCGIKIGFKEVADIKLVVGEPSRF